MLSNHNVYVLLVLSWPWKCLGIVIHLTLSFRNLLWSVPCFNINIKQKPFACIGLEPLSLNVSLSVLPLNYRTTGLLMAVLKLFVLAVRLFKLLQISFNCIWRRFFTTFLFTLLAFFNKKVRSHL